MDIDWRKVDELTLALMHLTTFEDHGAHRSWKGYDWDVLGRLHAAGWISNPATKAKSVVLSDDGVRRSRELFEKLFVVQWPDQTKGQTRRPRELCAREASGVTGAP